MRWLIALGLAVAACSGSGADGPSNAPDGAGGGGEASPGAGKDGGTGGATAAAGTSSSDAGAGASGGGQAGAATSSSGAPAGGTSAGTGGGSEAGQGGSSVAETGGAGAGGSDVTPNPQAGSGGEAGDGPGPDACAGVPAWDETVPWTALAKDELRTLRGELWKCTSQANCTTYPGHETAPGWKKVADCADPEEGGEPACQCTAGACCDGCYFRPRSHFCEEAVRASTCDGAALPACGGWKAHRSDDYWNLFCSGDTGGACTRWGAHTKSSGADCSPGTGCVASGGQSSCQVCPN